jgi:hypothetical protein
MGAVVVNGWYLIVLVVFVSICFDACTFGDLNRIIMANTILSFELGLLVEEKDDDDDDGNQNEVDDRVIYGSKMQIVQLLRFCGDVLRHFMKR